MVSRNFINGIEIITVETDHLRFSIIPEMGGKIISLFNTKLQKEFLWRNEQIPLQILPSGADYDSHFFGGIDELIPNDITETIDSINYPDHGELWTTPLKYEQSGEKITVHGNLPFSGISYTKTVYPDLHGPTLHLDYRIKNETTTQRSFLWKLHAALHIKPGDRLVTGAKYGKIVDPAYSRFTDPEQFNWPVIEGTDASIVPEQQPDAIDFFYLYNSPDGEMQLISGDHLFSYRYDPKVFPYQWYFASYGGFLGHYTAVLEPCTNMPISVNEAKEKRQCAVLDPGQTLQTTVSIYAGEKNNYIT